MQYGNVYVDERYSPILAPNLYGDSVLVPGVTYNDDYQGDASCGLVKIPRLTRDANADPGQPAQDFSHEAVANALIDLRLNNAFRSSKKIYKVQADAVSYKLADAQLSTSIQDKREDWQRSGLACLVHEGTADEDTAVLDATNIKKKLVGTRKALKKKHAHPDTVIMGVDAFAIMLEYAGKDYTPSTNENLLTNGRSGKWLGMMFYEGDLISGSAKYYDHAGTLQTVDMSKVDYIMYDHMAFSIVNNLEVMRIVDSTDFVGSLAQVEINSGYRVSNADMVMRHTSDTVGTLSEIDVTSAADAGGSTGDTVITVDPSSAGTGLKYVYKTGSTYQTVKYNDVLGTGWTDLPANGKISGTGATKITIAAITTTGGYARARGIAVLVLKA